MDKSKESKKKIIKKPKVNSPGTVKSTSKPKSSRSKPVKRNTSSANNKKVTAKIVSKPKKKAIKAVAVRRTNKSRAKSNSKRPSKFNKNLVKKYKRLNKKNKLRIKKLKKILFKVIPVVTTKKVVRSRSFRFAMVVLAIVVAGGAGMLIGHKAWGVGSNGILGQDSTKQVAEAPNSLSAVGPSQSDSRFTMYPTWAQNFANDPSSKLSSSYWNIYQGVPQNSNNEAEYYTNSANNINIQNGALNLTATKQSEPDGYNYASSRIDTNGKISFLYGRIDVTAKLPDSIGSWPAIWFLPANSKYEDMSPQSDPLRYLNGGEMDLAEEVGYQSNVEYGVVHTVSDLQNTSQEGAFNTVIIPNNNTQYDTYSLLWTPTTITFEVNNQPFFSYNKPNGSNYTTWAFDQPFYMIANLALGGVWGGQDTAAFPINGIDNSALPVTMSIKSVYYYPYNSN